jgi:hypothetical protein
LRERQPRASVFDAAVPAPATPYFLPPRKRRVMRRGIADFYAHLFSYGVIE